MLAGLRMPIEVTIALLFLNPLSWSYEPILMTSVPLVRSALLSLGCGGPSRHAIVLTPERLFRGSARFQLLKAPP